MTLLRKGLILLNIIVLLLSLSFLLMGGLFYCSVSYTGQFYGNVSCAGSMIFLFFIYIMNITSKNNGGFPLNEIYVFIPVIITILSILLTSRNIKKHRADIINKKVNTNFYLFNGMYGLTLGFLIIFIIMNLVMNYFYNLSNNNINKWLKRLILMFSIGNGTLSYASHHYINK